MLSSQGHGVGVLEADDVPRRRTSRLAVVFCLGACHWLRDWLAGVSG